MIFRRFSDVFSDVFPTFVFLTFVPSDVCRFWRLSLLTFVLSDVCRFWRLSFLTFVVLTFVVSDVCRSDVCRCTEKTGVESSCICEIFENFFNFQRFILKRYRYQYHTNLISLHQKYLLKVHAGQSHDDLDWEAGWAVFVLSRDFWNLLYGARLHKVH